MMRLISCLSFLICLPLWHGVGTPVRADILATAFFSGTIERFNELTNAQSTFSTVASATDPFPGLAGVVYDPFRNRVFASARISNRIYTLDGTTGSVLDFHQLEPGTSPSGLTLDTGGNLYVANNGGNTVSVFDGAWNVVKTITLPNIGIGNNLPNGVAFDKQDGLVISTFAGGGLFRYDPATDVVRNIVPLPLANGQIAVDDMNNLFVGGTAFSSDVTRVAADGNLAGNPFLSIDDTILSQPSLPYSSPDFTSPTAIVMDEQGDLIVGALGRTNPTSSADNFQSNGGLFRFSASGTLTGTIGTGITPISSLAMMTPLLTGDANQDNVVDGTDFNIWHANRQRAVRDVRAGDFNFDGIVNDGDWEIWNAHRFSNRSTAAVPEPTSTVYMVLLSGWMLATSRRARTKRDRHPSQSNAGTPSSGLAL